MPKPTINYLSVNSWTVLKNIRLLFVVLSLMTFSISFINAQTLAFPGAEGFGKYATGGRGGIVLKVTNLNDSGPGSLREALEASGTRTIVFEVGGTINLNNNIYATDGNFTLAGQTAPGDGILIKGGMLLVEDSNVIIRYIRIRPGPTSPDNSDGFNITSWGNVVENIIVDHCSISWAKDENLDMRAVNSGTIRNVTIQNSIISECGYGSLAGGGTQRKTYYKNFFAHNYERNIRTNYPLPGTFDFELVNNLIYGFKLATVTSLGNKFTVLNNHFKRSSQVNVISTEIVNGIPSGQGVVSETYAHIKGNIIPLGLWQNNVELNPYLRSTPYTDSGINAIPASEVANDILDHVGSSYPSRDTVDERLITQYHNGNGAFISSGEYPVIQGGQAPDDTDNDGMPDYWELENGLDPNNPDDRNFVQPDGYTNLEYYLNFMTIVQPPQVSAGEDQDVCEGGTATLIATGAESYEWSTGELTDSIIVNPVITTTYTVVGTHENGSTTTDEVTITVNPLPTVDAGDDVTICEGESVTLTASGGDEFEWNTGATTSSIVVSPSETTTYSVTVTGENGCSDEISVTVNIIPAPNISVSDDITINEGESITLSVSGGDSYEWSTGETTDNILVSPSSTTTYFVTGTVGICNSTDEVTVTVIPAAVANAGDDQAICIGDSTTLTASGGDSYEWSTGETTQSITVGPDVTTIYSVIVSNSFSSDSDEVTVTVNPLPTADAGEDVTICEGESIALSGSGGDEFEWSTGETNSNIIVEPVTTTTYTLTVWQNGCSASTNVTVFVNPAPVADAGEDVDIFQGESTTLTATGGDSYLWSTGETTQSISVSPDITTTYGVTVFQNGCADEDSVTVNVHLPAEADAGNDQTICEGESVVLTASGGLSYLWSTGETTSSITVNPSTETTYSVTVSVLNTSDTDDVTVFVNPIPDANAGGDVTINEGESTVLMASGGDSYEWSTGETTQSITVSPDETTLYTVFVSSNGCENFDEVTVNVNPTASANAGEDQSICEGGSVQLTATGGTNYLWSTGETTQSIVVNPETTTNYSVVVSNEFSSDTDEVTVFVNPLPDVTVTDNVTIVEGEYVTLSASGANYYEWSNGATQPNIAVSPEVTTTYVVKGYVNNCYEEESVTVNVVDTVQASAGENTSICFGESVTLTASGGENYIWSTGETTQSIEVSPDEETTYTVIVSNQFDSDTAEVTVSVENCEIDPLLSEDTNHEFSVFKDRGNPDILVIKLSGLVGYSQLLIHNVSGKVMHVEDIDDNNGEPFRKKYDVSRYGDGVYIISLIEETKQTTKKVIF